MGCTNSQEVNNPDVKVSTVQPSKPRVDIRDEIIATCKELFDGFDALDASKGEYKSDTTDFHAKAFAKDGLNIIVARGKFDGFTLEQHREFRKSNSGKKLNPQFNYTNLPETDGLKTTLIQIPIPAMMGGNRSFIGCNYDHDIGDVNWFINSSRGNEALYEQFKDKIGKDTIATQHY